MNSPQEISPALDGFAALPAFEDAKVRDAMRPGLMSCSPDVPLRALAGMMAEHRVHCLIVADMDPDGEAERPWGVVSDADILAATANRGTALGAWRRSSRTRTTSASQRSPS